MVNGPVDMLPWNLAALEKKMVVLLRVSRLPVMFGHIQNAQQVKADLLEGLAQQPDDDGGSYANAKR